MCIEDINCNHLPESAPDSVTFNPPHSGVYDRGCRGALDFEGIPDKVACEGGPSNLGPWYEKCCTWKNERCLPKTKDDGKYTF